MPYSPRRHVGHDGKNKKMEGQDNAIGRMHRIKALVEDRDETVLYR